MGISTRASLMAGAVLLAGLGVGSSARAATNLLIDGTFDPVTDLNGGTNYDASGGEVHDGSTGAASQGTAVGWTDYNTYDPVYTQSDLPNSATLQVNPQVAPAAQSGTQVIKAVAVYNNNPGLLQQTVTGLTAGTQMTFSAFAENSSYDPLGGSAFGQLQMQFQDSSGNAVGGLVTAASGTMQSTATRDVWTQLTLPGTVPAGATQVLVTLLSGPYGSGTGNLSGSVFFDSASLVAAPEPASIGLLGMALGAAAVRRRRQA